MTPRSATFLLILFVLFFLSWGRPLTFAIQTSRFSNGGDVIPAALLQQLEDAVAERNSDLPQRKALVEQIDQLLQAATPEARSRLIAIEYEVRFLEALNNLRLNQLELCSEQITQLLEKLDAKSDPELHFSSRSLLASVILLRGDKQTSLTAFEELLSGDLSGVPEFQLDRARINQAVAFERNGQLEEAIDRYQSVMLRAIEEKRDLAALQAGNNLLNLLLNLEDTNVAKQMLEALQPVLARNPQAIGRLSLRLFELRLLIWEGNTEAGIKGLREFIEQPVRPPAVLLGSAHKRLAEALQQQGNLEEAISHANQAVEFLAKLEPDAKHARILLAELHLQHGDYQTAADLLKLVGDPHELFISNRVNYYQVKVESQLRLAGLQEEANELKEVHNLLRLQAKNPLNRVSKNFEARLANLIKSHETQREAAIELARNASSRAERYYRYSVYGVAGMFAIGSVAALLVSLRRRAERMKLYQQQSLNAQLESLVTAKTLELKANLEKQAEMAHALEKKNRIETVGLLAGNIAHDINNLLQVIGNANLTLADTSLNQELRDQALAISNNSLRHGTGVIRQILDYARPQASTLQDIRVDEYIRNSQAMFQSVVGSKIQLNFKDASHSARIHVDPAHLTSAMLNLLSNALDAMPNGGAIDVGASLMKVTPQDTMHWQDIVPGAYVLLTVQDSGIGMQPEHLERAFEPFFSTKGFGEGTGLGLSSVRGFVKQSGGDVKLESSAAGTRVLMLLPQVLSPETTDRIPDNPSQDTAPIELLAGKRLLLVEDNEAVARSMLLLLTRLQLEVTWSSSGDDAAKRLQLDPAYDFVLSDLHMPGTMNGADLATWIADNHSKIGVVLMSGYNEVPVDCIRVPMLKKPFRLDELKKLLSQFVTR